MRKYTIFLLLVLNSLQLTAQGERAEIRNAEKLHSSYDFAKAVGLFRSALERSTDSLERCLIIEKMAAADNGLNMLAYATEPRVVSRRTVPRKDFFLYYSHLNNHSWIPQPNAFVSSEVHPAAPATYFEHGAKSIIFSAPDEEGRWSIFSSALQGDTLWSVPTVIEPTASAGSDIFPMLSPDGKSLYFSSDGLYGMGGYDLYVSRWDDGNKCWGTPENLGFPYSSPFDDLLFCDTPDGNFSVFASNRDCSADSITIYVLKYENSPVKRPVGSVERARHIAKLLPSDSGDNRDSLSKSGIGDSEKKGRKESTSEPQFKESTSEPQFKESTSEPQFKKYKTLLTGLRSKREAIAELQKELQAIRSLYETSTAERQKREAEQKLLSGEERITLLQREMTEISAKLQQEETELLMKGLIIDLPELEQAENSTSCKVQRAESLPEYLFERRSFGKLETVPVAEAEERFDFSFKIGDEAVIVEDILPEGLVYQIQLFVANRATIAKLKGISPVYERRQRSGKYLYAAGLFRSYREASANLSAVRRIGFSDALVIAFHNGKPIALKKAREMESSGADGKYGIVLSAYPAGIPADIRAIISENCTKEIVKSNIDGTVQYIIAPFFSRSEAESLASLLISSGAQGITIEKTE